MDTALDSTLSSLVDVFTNCSGHKSNEDSYASPAFAEFLNRPLTVNDIPMQSCDSNNKRLLRKNPTRVSWEDSIKNFIFDSSSINTKRKFEVCILLTEVGYKFTDATSSLLFQRHITPLGILIQVQPIIEEEELTFSITVRNFTEIQLSWTIDRYSVISSLFLWYKEDSTIVFCHDNQIDEYVDALLSMPATTWSISCTSTTFIDCKQKHNECIYVCPVYSCEGSTETRAVGTGEINVIRNKRPDSYEGRLNYYERCVRGSRHTSGRCYDCQVLYKTVTSVFKSPLSSPIASKHAKFVPGFMTSIT